MKISTLNEWAYWHQSGSFQGVEKGLWSPDKRGYWYGLRPDTVELGREESQQRIDQ